MGELQKTRMPGTILPNVVPLCGTIEIGAAGAIANQTGNRDSGVTWVRNGAGDYRGTLNKGYKRFVSGNAHVIAPAAATAKSLTAGTEANLQGVRSANALGTSGSPISTIAIATVRPDTGVLADPVNGQFISWTIWVQER